MEHVKAINHTWLSEGTESPKALLWADQKVI